MITFLTKTNVSPDGIKKLCQYVIDEEFDTDSIYIDIDSDGYIIGNIAQAMDNQRVMKLIKQFIRNNKSLVLFPDSTIMISEYLHDSLRICFICSQGLLISSWECILLLGPV